MIKDGGMALPNFKEYYHSAQLTPKINWCDENYASKWKNIEQNGRQISNILVVTVTVKNILHQVYTVSHYTLEMWLNIIQKYSLKNELPLLPWPAYDTHFITATQDNTYKQLINKGITAWCVLIKEDIKQELKQEFDFNTQDHFHYLKFRDFHDKK